MEIGSKDRDAAPPLFPPVHNYKTVTRKKLEGDGGQAIVIDNFDSLIPYDKQENVKNRFDLMRDIFAHTTSRTESNQRRIVDLFNKNPKRLNIDDPEIQKITRKDISFPDDYVPNISSLQQKLQTEQMSKALREDERQGYQRQQGQIPVGANYGTIAGILKDPKKLSNLANSYQIYKTQGATSVPAFLNYKQAKRESIDQMASKLTVELKDEIGTAGNIRRQQALEKIKEKDAILQKLVRQRKKKEAKMRLP